jgi:hypothetical protein
VQLQAFEVARTLCAVNGEKMSLKASHVKKNEGYYERERGD